MACKFVMICSNKNVICDSTNWEKKVIWWRDALFHVILTRNLVYPYLKKQTIELTIASPSLVMCFEQTKSSTNPKMIHEHARQDFHIYLGKAPPTLVHLCILERGYLSSHLNCLTLWTTRSHFLGVNPTISSPSCKYAIISASSCMHTKDWGFSKWVGGKQGCLIFSQK
jgi:hypothetical protein